jgi:hypothetical protein
VILAIDDTQDEIAMITLESLLREMTDRDAAARWPEPAYLGRQASSYDRRQTDPNDRETWFANNDYWECIRKEDTPRGEEWVIMEDMSPGCISRIWLPILPEDDGRLVRIYLDGNPDPVIEESFNHLITGNSFVKPPFAFISSDEEKIARMNDLGPGEGLVGSDFFLPLTYAKSCRISLNEMPFYYIINYRSYAPGTEVETFSMERFEAAAVAISQSGSILTTSGNVGDGQAMDCSGQLEPGQSLAIDTPSGPGAIRSLDLHLPTTLNKEDLRSLVLRINFDGEETVCCPVSEFFGGGIAVSPVRDWNREVTADGRFSCWSVMPYEASGQISLCNSGPRPIDAQLELSVGDWDWDERSMHFHANWRIASPIEGERPQDWNYITIKGQGVYAGDTLSVNNPQALWYGEGDERVYVDGEAFPSQLGTGTEDYYGFAWGMADVFSSPFVAMPQREALDRQDWSGHTTTSRTRVLDAIPFQSSLQFDMEAWHWPEWEHIEYAAATFWYARPGATHNRPM